MGGLQPASSGLWLWPGGSSELGVRVPLSLSIRPSLDDLVLNQGLETCPSSPDLATRVGRWVGGGGLGGAFPYGPRSFLNPKVEGGGAPASFKWAMALACWFPRTGYKLLSLSISPSPVFPG